MELSPSQKTTIRYQFETFCKKVIRDERCDYLRMVLRWKEQTIDFLELPETVLLGLGSMDDYPVIIMCLRRRGSEYLSRMNVWERRCYRSRSLTETFCFWPISWS